MSAYNIPVEKMINPLMKIANCKCLCNSGKKIKKCCGQVRYVDLKTGLALMDIVKKVKKAEKNA